MPLSPDEQKQLEAIERHLSREDPELARKLRSAAPETSVKVSHVWLPLVLLIGILVLPIGSAAKVALAVVVGLSLAAVAAYRMLRDFFAENTQTGTLETSREKPERR